MRRVFYFAMAALMCCFASCQKDVVNDTLEGEEAMVTFTVAAPEVETRTISDGEKVNIVHWAAFDNDGKPVKNLAGTAVINGKTATFTAKLVKHYDYNFVFWAHKGDEYGQHAAYNLGRFNEEGKVIVNYEGLANDENRDAFYKQEIITITKDNEVRTIELYRPFAQINFLAADYEAVEAVGLHTDMTSTVLIENLPTVLNGIDGTVDTALTGTTVKLSKAAIPTEDKYYEITDPNTGVTTKYGWYSMNYILAGDKANADVTGVFYHSKKTDGVNIVVPNVPYQRNHRTNIIGNFFTETVKVDIVVVESFDGEFIKNYPVI